MEAIRVREPFSMYSSRLCCCFLFRYWISSRYSRIPLHPARVPVWAMISLISPTEAEVPFSLYRVMLLLLAMIRARVVFPTPDGP